MIISMLLSALALGSVPVKMDKVFEGKIPWKGNYSVRLELPSNWYGDPGDFTRLIISEKGKTLLNLGDNNSVQAEAIKSVVSLPKGAKKLGKFLTVIPSAPKGGESLLGFDEWMGGSSSNQLNLIGKNSAGDVSLVFQAILQKGEIRDYDGDGKFDILSRGGMGEPTGKSASYDPFLVYRQMEKDGVITFKKDEELSKKWSAENTFEWHGIKYDSDLRVDEHGKLISKQN
ncbi:MAG: hypothetical protein ACXWQO_09470 [Bdellovibrionota bacterium]